MSTNHPQATIDFIHPPGQYYNVRGRRLWVEQDGIGEPVILLSGLGPAGSHVIFHPHFDTLTTDYRIVYVDLYGRGRSDRPENLNEITFESDVADVAALLSELNLGPVHLYGFSYGGLLAQAIALDHPHLVRSLVLANSLHSPEMWQLNHVNINREIANQCPEVWAKIQALRADGFPSTDPKMQELFASAAKLVRFYNPENARLLATEPGARNLDLYPLFCGEDVDFIIGNQVAKIPDFRPRLKSITAPILVLAGRFDRALYPALQYQFLTYAPKAEFHILERSGSFSHVEEPEEVFRILRNFWQRLV
ncbi:alpha/beta fold hydrolase [Nostoc sp. CENA67]|uniref:Alpha/beta fold hydrolase n=1 Tax=Amazonocrinis nigriterrae CENA67 TaxID=2794033 RepID=A0A8J7HNW6_9NOST|nr:alpha/beta hydrolase [Amazonocrinis nigriterrae]MBH8560705.1 alpha/beta fold hydrolase [Amazonocrinis nigriterrae CENA67]